MCLSSVYMMDDEEPELLCKNIQNVNVDETSGLLTFTDIMGIQYRSEGKIQDIDLVNNIIHIKSSFSNQKK